MKTNLTKKEVKEIFGKHKLKFPTRLGNIEIDMDVVEFVLEHWDGRFDRYYDEEALVEKLVERVGEIVKYNASGGIVYRWVFFDNESDFDVDNVGVHWTSNSEMIYDENSMHSIVDEDASKKKLVAEIEAKLPPNCVDYEETWDNTETYPEEDEIAVRGDKVHQIEVLNVKVFENPYYGRGI